jgi:GxxExxY protein
MLEKDRNILSGKILDACIEVHKELGPGLLESVYEVCLCKELMNRNIHFQRQVYLPVTYKNEELETNFRIDVLVEEEIIIELKAIDILLPVHHAQILTYLKLHNKRLGILVNFNTPKLIDGFKRIINGYDTNK